MKFRELSNTETLLSEKDDGGGLLKVFTHRMGGFTLVETVVAMALLVLVVLASIGAMIFLQRASSRQSQYATAMQMAQGKLDELLAIEYRPPVSPFGANTYYKSNYVLLTESKSGTAPPPLTSPPQSTGREQTPVANKQAIQAAERLLSDAIKASEKPIADAARAAADAAKAAADAAEKPDDEKLASVAAAKAEKAAAAQQAADKASAAVAAAQAALTALTHPAPREQPQPGGSTVPPQASDGSTMAAVMTTVEPVVNGHVITVEVEFMNHNQPTRVRLQTLVNRHSGGQRL